MELEHKVVKGIQVPMFRNKCALEPFKRLYQYVPLKPGKASSITADFMLPGLEDLPPAEDKSKKPKGRGSTEAKAKAQGKRQRTR